jgi:hypothetical protein
MRLARENTIWGYIRIVGELRKLGIDVSPTRVGQAAISLSEPAKTGQQCRARALENVRVDVAQQHALASIPELPREPGIPF